MAQLSTFILVHDGREFAPVTIRAESIALGRAAACALQLTDPSIPKVLARIKEIGGRFYLVRIEPSPFDETKRLLMTINGRELIGQVALAAGDSLVIGQYRLLVDRDNDALRIRVTYPDAPSATVSVSAAEPVRTSTVEKAAANRAADDVAPLRKARPQLEQWLKRRPWKTRIKVAPDSYLKPQQQKTDLATQYNWSPTRDLATPWPMSFFLICLLGVLAIAILAFVVWPSILAPGQISRAHMQTQLSPSLSIAATANGNSCRHCHQLGNPMDRNCASCHQAAGFHASITKEHEGAGIGCTDCHSEHQGREFSAKAAAFASCAGCHNDQNKGIYNGKTARTPHGGTLGYPMSGGRWIWPGLDEEALKLKPEVALLRLPVDTDQQWRSKQFHAIHLYRVKVAPGIEDVKDGVLQCSSCHKAFGNQLDRETPRKTCAKCHNGDVPSRSDRSLVDAKSPNCTSCHVQHYYDIYRWGDLLTESEQEKRQRAIDKNYAEAVKRSALPG